MPEPGWTLDELVAQVAAVLADGYPGPADRRARQVPDRRAIRWYTTIGLLDRPQVQGRTGRYGERHLLQLVAIKRLQAAGSSLSEIQAELAGASDSTLRRITDLAAHPHPMPGGTLLPRAPRRSAKFWTDAAPAQAATGCVVRYAVELADGVTVLVTPPKDAGAPDQEAIAAIQAAARPLLDELARLSLMTHLEDPVDGEGEPL